jgi:hypothetical protein
MSFPFGSFDVIEDKNANPNTFYLFDPKYKTIPVCVGEPPKFREEIDWNATAKASAVITGIQS